MWPVSAALSLFGTTSGVCSLLVGKSLELHLPQGVDLMIVIALCLFYLAAMGTSVHGGISLVLRPTDDFGSWTLGGRPVSRKAWRILLLGCYLAPWVGIPVMIFVVWLRA